MRVFVYPEKTREELGAERWQVSWEELRPEAKGKPDIDPDNDVVYRFSNHPSEAEAMKAARAVVDAIKTALVQLPLCGK